jgi:hypothetical protein
MSAQQTSFWEVHTYVQRWLDSAGSWPLIGTPEWVALDDNDPRKKAAVLDAARHWALRLELNQEARCEASHDVSAAADWSVISREMLQRNPVYIPRKAS